MAHASSTEKAKQHMKKLRDMNKKKTKINTSLSDQSKYMTYKWDLEHGIKLPDYKMKIYRKLKAQFEKEE